MVCNVHCTIVHGCMKKEYTAKTQYRKFEKNIPRKEIARPQSLLPHLCVCERFMYSHDRSDYSAAGKYTDPNP